MKFFLLFILSGCGNSPWEHQPVETIFIGQPLPISQKLAGLNIVSTGDADKPVVLFIHGSPGSWDGWVHYLANTELQQQAQLVAVDRPGYAASGGPVQPALNDQAAALLPALTLLAPGQKALLVGHSLGAPIALQVAAKYPEKVAGLVLIAASLDPAAEEPRWYNRAASWPWVRWALPEPINRSNTEMMSLAEELRGQAPLWPLLTQPTTIIHGDKDKLVYPENVNYAQQRMSPEQLRVRHIEDAGHFVIWTHREAVIEEIVRLLNAIEP